MKSNLHAVNSSTSGHPIRGLDQSDPDRRFRLDAMPNTVMSSLRWLSRPQMLDGNPAYSYMVETPQGDFAVMIGHYVNGEIHPFEAVSYTHLAVYKRQAVRSIAAHFSC